MVRKRDKYDKRKLKENLEEGVEAENERHSKKLWDEITRRRPTHSSEVKQTGIERHHNYEKNGNMNWKAVLRTKWQETEQNGRGLKSMPKKGSWAPVI